MTSEQSRRSRSGLARLARNCWIPAEHATDLAARCAFAVQSSAEFTIVASTTAARLHGLWLPEVPDVLHLATAKPATPGRAMTRTRRPEFIGHRLQLSASDIVMVNGIEVMTPARTWRDLAGVLGLPSLVAAGDSVLRGGVAVEELADVLARTSRSRYSRRARLALSLLDPRSRSRPESHMRVAVSVPGLPRFQVNEPVSRSDGGWLAEPDLSLPEAKLALEYQGRDHAEVERMRRDMTRNADMRRDGWLVYLYGPAETLKRPWQITTEVCATIRRRAPHLLTHATSGQFRAEWAAMTDHSTRN